jgi:hypothetical protein
MMSEKLTGKYVKSTGHGIMLSWNLIQGTEEIQEDPVKISGLQAQI